MPFEIEWRPEVLKKHEEFFNDSGYKEYLENAVNFNRKLNEERKMRLPYIDGQTGVAQRHYNSMRSKRERMPVPASDVNPGKVICYPAKHWHKKRYQYLKYFMAPKHRFDPEADMHTISQVENPSAMNSLGLGGPSNTSSMINEDSNHSGGASAVNKDDGTSRDGWSYYDDNMYDDGSMIDEDNDSGSDFDYEDSAYGSRKRKGVQPPKKKPKKPGKRNSRPSEPIPDCDKPFSCERFGGRASARRSAGGINYREDSMPMPMPIRDEDAPLVVGGGSSSKKDGKDNPTSTGYCDFCLGDSTNNKKTGKAEELVSCGECGRSGHPTCLQFTDNMVISVKKYSWQCIECKCCTFCGTSENDNQLLFCDDCDRGYHMYCLKPPIKEPPEGSWSCGLCIETFHKK